MDDLDAALMRLANAPVPTSLDGLESMVLGRIAAQPVARAGIGLGAMSIAVALVMGVLGAGLPAREASAISPLSPLGPVSPLAPSTLLAGAP